MTVLRTGKYKQMVTITNTIEPVYNDIGLYVTSFIVSDNLWYQFLAVNHNIILLGFNNTRL